MAPTDLDCLKGPKVTQIHAEMRMLGRLWSLTTPGVRRLLPTIEPSVEHKSGINQSEVCEGLREVADLLARERDLL